MIAVERNHRQKVRSRYLTGAGNPQNILEAICGSGADMFGPRAAASCNGRKRQVLHLIEGAQMKHAQQEV